MMKWKLIKTAPKDGRLIVLLSKGDTIEDGDGEIFERQPSCYLGLWNPEGDSWVDRDGNLNGDSVYTLAVTGTWDCEGGWLQPNEVTHWSPIPATEEVE